MDDEPERMNAGPAWPSRAIVSAEGGGQCTQASEEQEQAHSVDGTQRSQEAWATEVPLGPHPAPSFGRALVMGIKITSVTMALALPISMAGVLIGSWPLSWFAQQAHSALCRGGGIGVSLQVATWTSRVEIGMHDTPIWSFYVYRILISSLMLLGYCALLGFSLCGKAFFRKPLAATGTVITLTFILQVAFVLLIPLLGRFGSSAAGPLSLARFAVIFPAMAVEVIYLLRSAGNTWRNSFWIAGKFVAVQVSAYGILVADMRLFFQVQTTWARILLGSVLPDAVRRLWLHLNWVIFEDALCAGAEYKCLVLLPPLGIVCSAMACMQMGAVDLLQATVIGLSTVAFEVYDGTVLLRGLTPLDETISFLLYCRRLLRRCCCVRRERAISSVTPTPTPAVPEFSDAEERRVESRANEKRHAFAVLAAQLCVTEAMCLVWAASLHIFLNMDYDRDKRGTFSQKQILHILAISLGIEFFGDLCMGIVSHWLWQKQPNRYRSTLQVKQTFTISVPMVMMCCASMIFSIDTLAGFLHKICISPLTVDCEHAMLGTC